MKKMNNYKKAYYAMYGAYYGVKGVVALAKKGIAYHEEYVKYGTHDKESIERIDQTIEIARRMGAAN